jgi:hypothetical protein
MILLAILAQTGLSLPLGELPPQKLAPGRCVTFLWTRTEPPMRIAMADEAARTLRVSHAGKPADLAATGPSSYASERIGIVLDLDITEREGMTEGAIISQGALRVDEPGRDSVVVPVGGIRACPGGSAKP